MADFTIRKATRQGVKPLIALYSESGCGKTYSSLLLARGFAGPSGRVGLIDSESGRGELYADVIPGGYEVIPLEPPFSPARYIQAIETFERAGVNIIVIDSGSHEWEGAGGVCDMAGDNEERGGKAGLHNWRKPKIEHQMFVLKLLQSKTPIIICVRAKYKTRQVKENGRTQIVKDDYTSPIQAEDFIFEATAHGEILPDHSIRVTKCNHPSLRECFPKQGPITIQTGEALARWCSAAGAPKAAKPTTPAASQPEGVATVDQLKAKLWKLTKSIHNCPPDCPKGERAPYLAKLQQWLVDEINPALKLADLNAEQLTALIDEVECRLSDIIP